MRIFIISEEFSGKISELVMKEGYEAIVATPSDVETPSGDCCYMIDMDSATSIKWLTPPEGQEKPVTIALVPDLYTGAIPHWADDIISCPPRRIDVIARLRFLDVLDSLGNIRALSENVTELIDNVSSNLQIAQNIQRKLIPDRFPQMYGMRILSRYLCGARSGGDYFDVFEFKDKTFMGILMTDSSSYGLSSAFLSILMKLALKLSREESLSPSSTMKKLLDDVRLGMSEKDALSMCYMILNRKEFKLKFVSQGSVRSFVVSGKGKPKQLERLGDSGVKRGELDWNGGDKEIALEPGDRIVIFSDGFMDNFQKTGDVTEFLEKTRGAEAEAIANEMIYRVKSSQGYQEQGMPVQDSSLLVIDIDEKLLRLAT